MYAINRTKINKLPKLFCRFMDSHIAMRFGGFVGIHSHGAGMQGGKGFLDDSTAFYVLTPDVALLLVCLLLHGTYGAALFSSKSDGVDVGGHIERCFARHNMTKPASYDGETQPNRLEAGAPWGLYLDTGVLRPMNTADVRCLKSGFSLCRQMASNTQNTPFLG